MFSHRTTAHRQNTARLHALSLQMRIYGCVWSMPQMARCIPSSTPPISRTRSPPLQSGLSVSQKVRACVVWCVLVCCVVCACVVCACVCVCVCVLLLLQVAVCLGVPCHVLNSRFTSFIASIPLSFHFIFTLPPSLFRLHFFSFALQECCTCIRIA